MTKQEFQKRIGAEISNRANDLHLGWHSTWPDYQEYV